MSCVFCKRSVNTREHHIVPRCKGGTKTVSTCEDCESFIHNTWDHNQLRDTYNTIESIILDMGYQKFLKWLLKQNAFVTFKSDRNKHRNKTKYK